MRYTRRVIGCLLFLLAAAPLRAEPAPGLYLPTCDPERADATVRPGPHARSWENLGLVICPVMDPVLPPEMQPVADLPLPALNETLRGMLVTVTDPVAFGMTFQEGTDREIVEFQLAAMRAQGEDGSRDHAFHWYGHPHFNRAVVRAHTLPRTDMVSTADDGLVTAAVDRGFFLSANGKVQLYGEFLLPTIPVPGRGGDSEGPARQLAPAKRGGYPAILAIEGLQGNVGMYRWWHQAFADAGYLVFAFDFTGQGMSGGSDDDTSATRVNDAERALRYMLYESPVRDMIDHDRVGIIGHSMGAITTLELQDRLERQFREARATNPDAPRIVRAAVPAAPISEGSSVFELAEIPMMIQTGDHDGPIAPIPFVNPEVVWPVYQKLNGDRAMIVGDAASHAQHTNYPLMPTESHGREIAALYSVAWMDYFLRGDAGAKAALLEAHPNLSRLHRSEVRLDGETTILDPGAVPPGSTGGVLTIPARP